mgnify:CR=1 FL=1
MPRRLAGAPHLDPDALAARARALARAIRLIKDDAETLRLQNEFFAASEDRGTM